MVACRFSVVIPTFNRGYRIIRTIEAVTSLDYGPFEVIVVDDGSTDGTADRVRSIPDTRIRVVERANGGISAARNTGAREARGEFIVPLDDDDVPRSAWLKEFDDVLQDTGAVFVSCGFLIADFDTGEEIGRRRPHALGRAFGGHTASLLAGTFAVKRDVYFEIGGFAEGLQSSHQTEFGLRLLPRCSERGWKVAHTDEYLIAIQRHRGGGRIERNPTKLLAGTEFILQRHENQLASSPVTLANYHSIAGVAAYRLGLRSRARKHFGAALRARPLSMRCAGRLGMSLLRPLATRVWVTRPNKSTCTDHATDS